MKHFGDDAPSLAHFKVLFYQHQVLLGGPMTLFYSWIDVAGPSFPTLFGCPIDFIGVFLQVIEILADLEPVVIVCLPE